MEVGDRAGADGIAGSEGRGGMLVSTGMPTSQKTPGRQASQLGLGPSRLRALRRKGGQRPHP